MGLSNDKWGQHKTITRVPHSYIYKCGQVLGIGPEIPSSRGGGNYVSDDHKFLKKKKHLKVTRNLLCGVAPIDFYTYEPIILCEAFLLAYVSGFKYPKWVPLTLTVVIFNLNTL